MHDMETGIIEIRAGRADGGARLCQIAERLAGRGGIEILRRIGGVAEGEPPAEIHQQFFTRRIGSGKSGKCAQQQGGDKE